MRFPSKQAARIGGRKTRSVVVVQVEIQYIECSASVQPFSLALSTLPLFTLARVYRDEWPMVGCVEYLRIGIVQKSRFALLKNRLLSREWTVSQRKLQVNPL